MIRIWNLRDAPLRRDWSTISEIGGALTCDMWVQMSKADKEPSWGGVEESLGWSSRGEGDEILEDGVL